VKRYLIKKLEVVLHHGVSVTEC